MEALHDKTESFSLKEELRISLIVAALLPCAGVIGVATGAGAYVAVNGPTTIKNDEQTLYVNFLRQGGLLVSLREVKDDDGIFSRNWKIGVPGLDFYKYGEQLDYGEKLNIP